MMPGKELLYLLALPQVPGIGNITARKLIQLTGAATPLFETEPAVLQKTFPVPSFHLEAIRNFGDFLALEKELDYCRSENIRIIPCHDPGFPEMLNHCPDAPLCLFVKGDSSLNKRLVIALVGTRKATDYGKKITRKMIEGLADLQPVIVSGLAHGIDKEAHTAALETGLDTWAVVGHGFRFTYPASHKILAQRIREKGLLISEFFSGTKPDKENFPRRNRIIAGLSDAVVVIEAAEKGGALITARFAHQYQREVFAVPGRATDLYSTGCNALIKSQVAVMAEYASDIKNHMGWVDGKSLPAFQPRLFPQLLPEEVPVFELLTEKGDLHMDVIGNLLGLSPSKLALLLFEMEIKGILKKMPGQVFRLD